MKVIFSNDDFGLTYGFTKGISDCFLNGVTTSASICINGHAYKYALKLLKTKLKNLTIGLHLNLDYGNTGTKELQNKKGKYKFTFLKYYILIKLSKKILVNIESDLEFQFKKAISDNLKITFVNGHDHIYMIPEIFVLVCKLCKKYRIKYIRLPREPYYLTGNLKQDLGIIFSPNIIKFLLLNNFCKTNYKTINEYSLKTTDAFYGVLYTQRMNISTVISAIKSAQSHNYKSIEILGHPSNLNDPRDKIYETNVYEQFAKSEARKVEKKLFQSNYLKKFLKEKEILLRPFNNL